MSESLSGELTPPAAASRFASVRASGRVVRNVLWLLFSQGGVRLIGFGLGTVLARVLGVGDFGTYMYVMTYVSYFGILSDAGLGRLLIRDVARDRATAQEYLGQITALRLTLAAAAYALMLVVALVIATPSDRTSYVAVAGLSLFTGAVSGVLASMFNAREEMRVAALFGLLSSSATAVLVLTALLAGAGLAGIFTAATLATVPPLAFLLIMWRRRERGPRLKASWQFWRKALRQSYAYAILGLVGVIYFRIDALMLTWIDSAEATGIYTAAYRLLDAVTDAPGVIVAALFPMLARMHRGPRARLRRAYLSALGTLTLLGLPVMLLLIALARPIITVLYGDDYLESVTVLRILAVAVFLIFVDTANTLVLYSGDNLRTVMLLSVGTMTANVVLNLILIPRYSYNGAAVATILSTAVSLLIFTPLVLRSLREPQPESSGLQG